MQALIGRNYLYASRQLFYCSSSTLDKALRIVKIHCFVDEACITIEEFRQSPCQTGITLGS